MIRVLDTHREKKSLAKSESGGDGVVTGGKTFVDRFVVDDASRSDAMIYMCVSSN